MTTFDKGNLSLVKAIASFMEAGFLCSNPIGDGCVYDLVVDDGSRLQRVQVKSGRVRRGTVEFQTKSNNGRYQRGPCRNYRDKADLFAVYCPENGAVYVIPVREVGVSIGYLRLDPPRNNQKSGVRWAEDYRLKPLTSVAGGTVGEYRESVELVPVGSIPTGHPIR